MNEKTKTERPAWFPILMSCAVYPGIGQFLQKRKAAGVVFMTSSTLFLILLIVLLYRYFSILIPILLDGLEGNSSASVEDIPSPAQILKPIGVFLFIYLANVVDVFRGQRKSAPTA